MSFVQSYNIYLVLFKKYTQVQDSSQINGSNRSVLKSCIYCLMQIHVHTTTALSYKKLLQYFNPLTAKLSLPRHQIHF